MSYPETDRANLGVGQHFCTKVLPCTAVRSSPAALFLCLFRIASDFIGRSNDPFFYYSPYEKNHSIPYVGSHRHDT